METPEVVHLDSERIVVTRLVLFMVMGFWISRVVMGENKLTIIHRDEPRRLPNDPSTS